MATFPHLTNATPYPTTDINVYKYRNEFDYERYQKNVHIKVCRVPWCGDYDNVVKFEDLTARDEYIDSLEGFEFDTMFNVLPNTTLKVPIPATSMQLYNYLVIDLPMVTSESEPIEYADSPRISRYLYFIDTVTQRASSTCECSIRVDVWATYIEYLTFSYAMLERGHAPLAATDVDEYLSDPAAHNEYLLTPDVVMEDEARTIVHDERVINFTGGEMWFVICTDAWPIYEWGSLSDLTARTPASDIAYAQSRPSPGCFALDPAEIDEFFTDVNNIAPQFMATIRCTFVVERDLVDTRDDWEPVEFCGHTLIHLTAYQRTMDLIDVTDADFGFDDRYKGLAKLYTYPYSCIRIYSEDGDEQIIRIENLAGALQLRVMTNLVFPYIAIDTHLLNVGAVTESMLYNGIRDGWGFRFGGSFASYFKRHNIGVFYVVQSGEDHATWAHLYDREQARLAANNDYDSATTNAAANYNNAVAAANASYNNAVAAANTSYNNSANTANNIITAAALNVAANEDLWTCQSTILRNCTTYGETQLLNDRIWDKAVSSAQLEADIDSNAVATTNNTINTTVNGIETFVSGAISGAATGASVATVVPGAGTVAGAVVGGVIGGVAASASTLADGHTTASSLAIALSNTQSIYDATQSAADGKTDNAVQYAESVWAVKEAQGERQVDIKNDLESDLARNNANLILTNAANTRDTEIANAARTRDALVGNAARTQSAANNEASNNLDTALSAIENERKQQGLEPPYRYGETINGEIGATRPMGVWTQIVTQSDSAIKYAGDNFLRYGYMLDMQWNITDLQVMKHFTYWQCADVWCAGAKTVVEAAQQTIKDIMKNGVTVWSDPTEIGQVSIYDN